jgi:hypothetical protein
MNNLHLLKLGRLGTTAAAQRLLDRAQLNAADLLNRHARGDWGELDPAARRVNYHAAQIGLRVVSTYTTATGKVCVVTDPDRSATTILLPDELAYRVRFQE